MEEGDVRIIRSPHPIHTPCQPNKDIGATLATHPAPPRANTQKETREVRGIENRNEPSYPAACHTRKHVTSNVGFPPSTVAN